MFGYHEIETLSSRKQALLAQSGINRRLLVLESQRLQSSLAWVDRGIGLARKARPAWIIAAPLLGFWFARKVTRRSYWWAKLAFFWQLFRRASSIARRFQAAAETGDET